MFVEMGTLVRAVGLRGELKLLPTADFHLDVMASGYLRRRDADDRTRPAVLQRHRWKGQTVVVMLEGIESREAAEAAVGDRLGFLEEDYDRADFPRGDEHLPFAYCDLEVWTEDGERVGVVEEVLALPANWVLRVRGERGEVLVPVIPPVMREMDRAVGRIVIHPLPGLLDGAEEA